MTQFSVNSTPQPPGLCYVCIAHTHACVTEKSTSSQFNPSARSISGHYWDRKTKDVPQAVLQAEDKSSSKPRPSNYVYINFFTAILLRKQTFAFVLSLSSYYVQFLAHFYYIGIVSLNVPTNLERRRMTARLARQQIHMQGKIHCKR